MTLKLTLPLVIASALLAGAVAAEDNEAGVPLTPAEAAGVWTVEADGHAVCLLRLTPDHGARADQSCGEALPTGITGWATTADGMALTGAGGAIPFNRWSNSLFVSHRASGLDVQLMRGPPQG